ncbi:MAG: hypothetical protein AAGG48_18640 [Planctomycetota bacterium]
MGEPLERRQFIDFHTHQSNFINMPFFDECCLLIPASTLEDFPSDLSDDEARSLLAGWTVLWHPALLAAADQTPLWYRADAPPEPIGKRLVVVPSPSQPMLPSGFEQKSSGQKDVCWVSGADRESMLAAIADRLNQLRTEAAEDADHPAHHIDSRLADPWPSLEANGRTLGVDDFYAAGYAALQVQVMTRRLRYTSNLDEIHLQTCAVSAAKAFLAGDAAAAIASLHDVFDCLAEERDHYFSSDPHLVDLTLTVPSTVPSLLDSFADHPAPSIDVDATDDDSTDNNASDNINGSESPTLPTPANVLIDAETAAAIASVDDERRDAFCRLLVNGVVGWAGGGPNGDVCLDTMTLSETESLFLDAWKKTGDAIGTPPKIYGRFRGATPSDMTRILVNTGYVGIVPLDFASGTGHGDEAKVILQSGSAELEALTVKPTDASSDAAFLTLGMRLGEAIDGGEIATALLAHWPGKTCPAFEDVKRVASWSLVLGRFWKLEDYFTQGEHPYHHGTSQSTSSDAHTLLDRAVQQQQQDPISSLALSIQNRVLDEQQSVLTGMTRLVTGEVSSEAPTSGDDVADSNDGIDTETVAALAFAKAIGASSAKLATDSHPASASLTINPNVGGVRTDVTVRGPSLKNGGKDAKHIYAVSHDTDAKGEARCDATVDVPGCGFLVVRGGNASGSNPVTGFFRNRLRTGPKPIAEADLLRNEFMEVTVCQKSGGIAGVYSGSSRGNRMSMRLIRHRVGLEAADETVMQCDRLSTFNTGTSVGRIETSGSILDAKSDAKLAAFRLSFTLLRGTRYLKVDGEVTPEATITGSPWHEYLAARMAVANESAICRSLVRDKLVRARGRRVVSPMGVVIDEAERQTLVSGAGLAFHRRVGERFLDTLLQVEGETKQTFTLHYGFDIPNAVAATRALIAPPVTIAIDPDSPASEIGWIVHAGSRDVLLTCLDVQRRDDGKLVALVRVIQSMPQSIKTKLRFFRDVEYAVTLQGPCEDWLQTPAPSEDDPRKLASSGDAVTISIESHGVVDLLVVFAG